MILVALGIIVFGIAFLAKTGRLKEIKAIIKREYDKHYGHMAEHALDVKIGWFVEMCEHSPYERMNYLYNEAEKIILFAKRNTTKADKTARKLYNILSAWELNLNQIQLA